MEKHPQISPLKFGVTAGGAIVFLMAGIIVALQTRHYQITGEPMPNGKGGHMEYAAGYYLALTLFCMAIGWFLFACRYWRKRPE
jgi:hypothetical protein